MDLVLAMVTTGIYDSILHEILAAVGRAEEYMNLLTYEYAYAHSVCNSVKNDDHFLTGSVTADKRVVFAADTKGIQKTLTTLFGAPKETKYPGPQPTEIVNHVGEPLWSGDIERADVAVSKDYLATRTDVIAGSLQSLITKLNGLALSPKNMCLRFTNGLLLRAIYIAPELTKSAIWDSLPDTYKAILTTRLGGSRRRRTRRRTLRGGATPEEKLAYTVYVVEYIVSLVSLPTLFESLLNLRNTGGLSIPDVLAEMERIVEGHIATVHRTLEGIEWDRVYDGSRRLTGEDLVGHLLRGVLAPGEGPAPTAGLSLRESTAVEVLRDIGRDLGVDDTDVEMGIKTVLEKARKTPAKFYYGTDGDRPSAVPFINAFLRAVHKEDEGIEEDTDSDSVVVSFEEALNRLKNKPVESAAAAPPGSVDPGSLQATPARGTQSQGQTQDPDVQSPRSTGRRSDVSSPVNVVRQLYWDKLAQQSPSQSASRSRSRSREKSSKGGAQDGEGRIFDAGPRPDWL